MIFTRSLEKRESCAEKKLQPWSHIDHQEIKFPMTSHTVIWAIGLYVSACIVFIDLKHFFCSLAVQPGGVFVHLVRSNDILYVPFISKNQPSESILFPSIAEYLYEMLGSVTSKATQTISD